MKSTPRFRIEGKSTKNPKVIIQCSNCEVDIRPMKKTEELDPRKGIYCSKCDDGVAHLNAPIKAQSGTVAKRGRGLAEKMVDAFKGESYTSSEIATAVAHVMLASIKCSHNVDDIPKDLSIPRELLDAIKSTVLNELQKIGWE